MNRDEIKGKGEKLKGTVKQKAGEITNDAELEAEGRVERAAGEARDTFGKAKRKAGDAIDAAVDEVEEE